MMGYTSLFYAVLVFVAQSTCHSETRYQEYIYAPAQRTVVPQKLHSFQGRVINPGGAVDGSVTTFQGINSSIILDFGKDIAGTVQFTVSSIQGENQYLGFSFTESSLWISPYECDSATVATRDSPLWFNVPSKGRYAASKEHQRGGFRYMSIWHNSTGSISVDKISVNFTASPQMKDMQDYAGYFHSSSEKLNRVWYAGAYTNQLCDIDPHYGNALGVPGTGWYFNSTIANGSSVLVDGAKRDRLVWPGDIAISGPTMFVSTNSLDGIRNGLNSLFMLQNSAGQLPWAGQPFTNPAQGVFPFSFTYHLYTLLDVYYYYTFTGDTSYIRQLWGQYKHALNWSLGTIDASMMANVTSPNDWLRSGMGGHNVEANSILYHTLDMSLLVAAAVGDESVIGTYKTAMKGIKQAVNEKLWDHSQNLFYDNDTIQVPASVHPQDGNSWAIISGVANAERALSISNALKSRWIRPYGAPAPEAGPTISPFVSGFEVQAHYLAGNAAYAVDLIEFMWADFMLDDPRMTNSSFIEGYSTSGNLTYAPYANPARISYAHGWATGPTSALTFYGAGLKVSTGGGQQWSIQPRLGGLTSITAGFETPLGSFSVDWRACAGGATGSFSTPKHTKGTVVLSDLVSLRGSKGSLKPSSKANGVATYNDVPGGNYRVTGGLGK